HWSSVSARTIQPTAPRPTRRNAAAPSASTAGLAEHRRVLAGELAGFGRWTYRTAAPGSPPRLGGLLGVNPLDRAVLHRQRRPRSQAARAHAPDDEQAGRSAVDESAVGGARSLHHALRQRRVAADHPRDLGVAALNHVD